MIHILNQISNHAFVGMIIMLTLAICFIVVFMFLHARHRQNNRNSQKQNDLIQMAVDLCGLSVLEYDVKADLLTSRMHQIIPKSGYSLDELTSRLHPNDLNTFSQKVTSLLAGQCHSVPIKGRLNTGSMEHPNWRNFEGHLFSDADKGGSITSLFFVGNDVTDIVREAAMDEENGIRYKQLFQTSLTAMSFYSPDGRLLDLNDKMREICGLSGQSEEYFREGILFDMPLLKNDFDRYSREDFCACQKMEYPDLGVKKYIEFRISPLFDDQGNLAYYIITCRDVTPDRDLYLAQHQREEELQRSLETINQYEDQLHYLLKNNLMFVWWTDIKKKTIYFSQSLSKVEFTYDFDTYVERLTDEKSRVNAKLFFDNYKQNDKDMQSVHRFSSTPLDDSPQWYVISGLPTHNEKGKLTGHFGVLRNITYLMDTQERLRRETERANDSGRMKSMFLANMTHEIRTPLNAIVGFSDLLQTIEAPEERAEFIRIIRNNCDMLLRLINDILEASHMDQGQQSITLEEVDFAHVFNDICQTLAQRVQNPAVQFLSDNPYETMPVRIDKGRVQQVITNFVTNAVKYTEKGHIKVGYQCENGELYVYCEDTGTGIPKDKQDVVFERFVKLNDFVQGTGLGLSICKSIVERCGGRIGVISEGEGQGSTFWMRIPC